VYTKPTVTRYGTFRELTQLGFSGASDGFTIIGPDGSTSSGNDLDDCRS
jgi:hypothetical protein